MNHTTHNSRILTSIIFIVSIFVLPFGVTAHSDTETVNKKDSQAIATEYRAHRDNYLKAKSVFETARTEITKEKTDKAKSAYINALINLLVARLDSLNYLIQVQTAFSEIEHTTLESGINTEKAWLETQRNLNDSTSSAKALRGHIDTYDLLTKNIVGAIIATRQQSLVKESNKFVENLKTHIVYIESTGASVEILNAYLSEYNTASQKASSLLAKASLGFLTFSSTSTYTTAIENLIAGGGEVRKGSNVVLFLYDAIQHMTASLGGNSPDITPSSSKSLDSDKTSADSPNPPVQI